MVKCSLQSRAVYIDFLTLFRAAYDQRRLTIEQIPYVDNAEAFHTRLGVLAT